MSANNFMTLDEIAALLKAKEANMRKNAPKVENFVGLQWVRRTTETVCPEYEVIPLLSKAELKNIRNALHLGFDMYCACHDASLLNKPMNELTNNVFGNFSSYTVQTANVRVQPGNGHHNTPHNYVVLTLTSPSISFVIADHPQTDISECKNSSNLRVGVINSQGQAFDLIPW